jgi:hypothetical protein
MESADSQLRSWQACTAYKKAVYAICEDGALSQDWKRRGQLASRPERRTKHSEPRTENLEPRTENLEPRTEPESEHEPSSENREE